MLSSGPETPLSRANFAPLIASIITPALLYASTTRSLRSSSTGILPKYLPFHLGGSR